MRETYEIVDGIPICEPREDLCLHCGKTHSYSCGRLLMVRDAAEKEQRCLDGIYICIDCSSVFGEFMERVGDAQAVDAEWEGG